MMASRRWISEDEFLTLLRTDEEYLNRWIEDETRRAQLLRYLAAQGHLDVIRTILAKYPDSDIEFDKITPLLSATSAAQTEIVEIFLKFGADANSRGKEGVTSLMAASGEGHTEIARTLISAGADVDAADDEGWTSLHYAAEQSHLAVAELLINKGANVNAQTKVGSSSLLVAAGNNRPQMVDLLLRAGADPSLADGKGYAPLIVSSEFGYTDIAEILLGNSSADDKRTALKKAFYHGNYQIAQLLTDHGVAADSRGRRGVNG